MKIKNTSMTLTMTLVILLSLGGCGLFGGEDSYFRNRNSDYLNANDIAPIKVPEGMTDKRLGQLYPMPKVATNVEFESGINEKFEVPRPEPLANNLIAESVKIQRLGSDRWILMNVSPGEIWPRIRAFLGDNGLTIVNANIKQGIIDTNWIQFKTDLGKSDRYRVQIDQGVQPETSEIHILHQSIEGKAVLGLQKEWPQISTSSERESLLLDELAATLASDVTIGGTSLLAQSIGGEAKSSLMVRGSEPVLVIRLNRARARATLHHAIKQEGFTVYESASDKGIYYLSYVKISTEKKGWFSGMFGGDDEPSLVSESPYTIEQLLLEVPTGSAFDNAPVSRREKETSLADAPGYLLFMTGDAEDFTVRLRDPYGKRLEARKARELLTILRKNLI